MYKCDLSVISRQVQKFMILVELVNFFFALMCNILLLVQLGDVRGYMPAVVPIRYEVQIQLPTASDKDPLIPTFFGLKALKYL